MDINSDLLEYFEGDSEGFPMLSELERARARSIIVSILELRCGLPKKLAMARDRIPGLYEYLASIYKIPFPEYLLRLLYKIEERATLHIKYRDHMLHLFYVFCLGCYIYDNSGYYRPHNVEDSYRFMANWVVAAFLHDLGYAFSEEEFRSKHDTSAEFSRVVRCENGDIKESFALFWSWVLTLTKNGQPEFSVEGSAANAIQRVDKRELGLAFPYFWSTVEKCCKFDQYNGQDLFEELPGIEEMREFTGNEINISGFYIMDGRLNHGIESSLLLLFILKARASLISNNRLPEEIASSAREMDQFCDVNLFKDGIWAIALHDLSKEYMGASLEFTGTPPLISLLLLADGLQCWDRQYFRQEGRKISRSALPSNAVGIQCSDEDIFWYYDEGFSNNPEYINASYKNIVLGECALLLSKNDVEEIIKKPD